MAAFLWISHGTEAGADDSRNSDGRAFAINDVKPSGVAPPTRNNIFALVLIPAVILLLVPFAIITSRQAVQRFEERKFLRLNGGLLIGTTIFCDFLKAVWGALIFAGVWAVMLWAVGWFDDGEDDDNSNNKFKNGTKFNDSNSADGKTVTSNLSSLPSTFAALIIFCCTTIYFVTLLCAGFAWTALFCFVNRKKNDWFEAAALNTRVSPFNPVSGLNAKSTPGVSSSRLNSRNDAFQAGGISLTTDTNHAMSMRAGNANTNRLSNQCHTTSSHNPRSRTSHHRISSQHFWHVCGAVAFASGILLGVPLVYFALATDLFGIGRPEDCIGVDGQKMCDTNSWIFRFNGSLYANGNPNYHHWTTDFNLFWGILSPVVPFFNIVLACYGRYLQHDSYLAKPCMALGFDFLLYLLLWILMENFAQKSPGHKNLGKQLGRELQLMQGRARGSRCSNSCVTTSVKNGNTNKASSGVDYDNRTNQRSENDSELESDPNLLLSISDLNVRYGKRAAQWPVRNVNLEIRSNEIFVSQRV